jgi:choline-glycine betaine transporter
MDALRNAMIIGALPFTVVMGLMCIALALAMLGDSVRGNTGAKKAPARSAKRK